MALPAVGTYVKVDGAGTIVKISPNFIEVKYSRDDTFTVSDERAGAQNRNMRPELEVGQVVYGVKAGRVHRVDNEGVFLRFDDGKGVMDAEEFAMGGANNNNNNSNLNNYNVNVNAAPANRPPLAAGEPLRANAPVWAPGQGFAGGRRKKTRRDGKRKSRKVRKNRRNTRKSRQ